MREIAFVGEPGTEATEPLAAEARRRYQPNTVMALKRPDEPAWLPLLEGRDLVGGRPTAYVCRTFTCGLAVTEAEGLRAQLEQR